MVWSAGTLAQTDSQGPEWIAAQRLRQLTQKLLSRDSKPGAAALRMAQVLLEQASTLAPEDPEVWRLMIEAWDGAESKGAIRPLLASYVRAAPEDDVAQLRLAREVISHAQTVSERIEICERMAGLKGAAGRLSEPLRSRLAWDAAEMHRDQGDDAGYRRMVRQALDLDGSNKAAAEAVYRLVDGDPTADGVSRMGALLVWHAADPVNSSIHLLIARNLLNGGDYGIAATWFDSADLLATYAPASEKGATFALARDWALSLWGAGFADQALALIASLKKEGAVLPVELEEIVAAIHGLTEDVGQGKLDEARKTLARAPASPRRIALGLALAEKDQALRIKELTAIHHDGAGTFEGVMAYEHLRTLRVVPALDERGRTVGSMVRQVPEEMRRIAESPGSFLALRVAPVQGLVRYGEPIRFMVQLTNIGEMPLSVGPDGVAPTVVALIPQMSIGNESRTLSPQIVDLDRRLTLAPGQSIVVRALVDVGDLVELLDRRAEASIELSVTAVLNPVLEAGESAGGTKVSPGLMGLAARSRSVERQGAGLDDVEIASAIVRVRGGGAEGMFSAAWLAWVVGTLSPEREDQAIEAAKALNSVYESYRPAQRAWIASFLVPGDATRRRAGRLIERALLDDEPMVQYSAVLALAEDAEAPELTALLRLGESKPGHRFAKDYREVLSAGVDSR